MTSVQRYWFFRHMMAYLAMQLDGARSAHDWEGTCAACCARMMVFRAHGAKPELWRWHLGDCPRLDSQWKAEVIRCPALALTSN